MHKNILVVDDNEMNRVLLSRILKVKWYNNTFTASDWEEAYNMVRQRFFDIIFMDIEMPKLNWIEATKAIKDLISTSRKKIKIIWLSGHTCDKIQIQCLENWMDWFETKPIKMENILAHLQNGN